MTIPIAYTTDFLKELGLDTLPPEERTRVLGLLEDRFDKVIMDVIIERLSAEQFEAFKKALRSDNPEVEVATVTAQVPGLAGLLEEQLLMEYRLIRSVMAS